MIINTGQRTDIPAFYHEWFFNRIKEGYVYVRNPYYPKLVTKYILNPQVVDCICFCSKNPHPMLQRMDELSSFRQFWFITITPYGKDIEPFVPNKFQVIDDFIQLSKIVGKHAIVWRYDPIFINSKYTLSYHLRAFETICNKLANYTETCVISFIDLYKKIIRNFKNIREVNEDEKLEIAIKFSEIANRYHIDLKSCCEDKLYDIDNEGCQSQHAIEKAIFQKLNIPQTIYQSRKECHCLLGNDIGHYDTCKHGCLYCYANTNSKNVFFNSSKHDPLSPILIGHIQENDIIQIAKQESFVKK